MVHSQNVSHPRFWFTLRSRLISSNGSLTRLVPSAPSVHSNGMSHLRLGFTYYSCLILNNDSLAVIVASGSLVRSSSGVSSGKVAHFFVLSHHGFVVPSVSLWHRLTWVTFSQDRISLFGSLAFLVTSLGVVHTGILSHH